jgi:hypothetical protein
VGIAAAVTVALDTAVVHNLAFHQAVGTNSADGPCATPGPLSAMRTGETAYGMSTSSSTQAAASAMPKDSEVPEAVRHGPVQLMPLTLSALAAQSPCPGMPDRPCRVSTYPTHADYIFDIVGLLVCLHSLMTAEAP